MFRHDFEFVDGHRSHLGDGAPAAPPMAASEPPSGAVSPSSSAGSILQSEAMAATVAVAEPPAGIGPQWTPDGEAELSKIPFFVRGKVRRNTETFARERGLERIDAEALYDAKAHYSR
jgi:light-independent protochlorophyllide reductase subunit B